MLFEIIEKQYNWYVDIIFSQYSIRNYISCIDKNIIEVLRYIPFFFYIIGEQTFSYVLYNVEDGTRVCGDGVFDVDGVYSLSTSGLSSGIYNIEISIGSVVYQGEFEIE